MGLLSALIQGTMKAGYAAGDAASYVSRHFDGGLVRKAAELTVHTVGKTTQVALSATSLGLAAVGTVAAHASVLANKTAGGVAHTVNVIVEDRTKVR